MTLKEKAEHILQASGLLEHLKAYGTPHIIGSLRMDMMAWNDLDIDVENTNMSIEKLYELTDYIMQNVTGMNQYGIEIASIEIKLLDLPEDNKDAVFERMISERGNMAATYTAEGNSEAQVIRNTTDKDAALLVSEAQKKAEILRAEGEAQYMQIMAESYDSPQKAEFYSFIRSLDALQNAVQGGDKTIILDKDSPITQIFYNY